MVAVITSPFAECYFSFLGSSVRQRVVVYMKGRFKSVDEAEEEFGLSIDSYLGEGMQIEDETELQTSEDVILNSIDHLGQSQLSDVFIKTFGRIRDKRKCLLKLLTQSSFQAQLTDLIVAILPYLSAQDQRMLLDRGYLQQARDMGINSNPADFATRSLKAMLLLQKNQKPNLMYLWCSCLYNEEGKPSLDLNRMPFGMLQYIMEFFSCTHVAQVCMVV